MVFEEFVACEHAADYWDAGLDYGVEFFGSVVHKCVSSVFADLEIVVDSVCPVVI